MSWGLPVSDPLQPKAEFSPQSFQGMEMGVAKISLRFERSNIDLVACEIVQRSFLVSIQVTVPDAVYSSPKRNQGEPSSLPKSATPAPRMKEISVRLIVFGQIRESECRDAVLLFQNSRLGLVIGHMRRLRANR